MKKICFLIGNFNNAGGTERVTSIIANELCKKDYDVSILSLVDGSNAFFTLEGNIKTYSLYRKKISFKNNFLGVVWKIRQFVKNNKIDTLIVVDSISCLFTVPALSGFKINHICWEHFNFNNNNGVKFRDIARNWAAKYCDYVVTLTEKDKRLWELGLKNINSEIFAIANPSPYGAIENIASLDYKVILAIGRLTHVKGFDLLIEAWSQVCQSNKDWTLRIVGSGEEEEKLKQQAEKLGIDNKIEFISATKNVEQYYKTSSFYCLSSRHEGFPMVLLEAQAFGLPIVSFDCDTGPSEIINHNFNGYLCKVNEPESLALGLIKMINSNKDGFEEMSYRSKLNSENYTIDKIVEKWKDVV